MLRRGRCPHRPARCLPCTRGGSIWGSTPTGVIAAARGAKREHRVSPVLSEWLCAVLSERVGLADQGAEIDVVLAVGGDGLVGLDVEVSDRRGDPCGRPAAGTDILRPRRGESVKPASCSRATARVAPTVNTARQCSVGADALIGPRVVCRVRGAGRSGDRPLRVSSPRRGAQKENTGFPRCSRNGFVRFYQSALVLLTRALRST